MTVIGIVLALAGQTLIGHRTGRDRRGRVLVGDAEAHLSRPDPIRVRRDEGALGPGRAECCAASCPPSMTRSWPGSRV